MGRPRKDPRDLRIRINVQLSVEDIEYLDTHWEGRSTAFRKMIREHQDNDTTVPYNLKSLFNELYEMFDEPLKYEAKNGRDIDRFIPTFAGLYEKKYGKRPADRQVSRFLMEMMEDLGEL